MSKGIGVAWSRRARRRPALILRPVKRFLSVALSVLVLGGLGLAGAGCGSAAHYVGAVAAHHALNHVLGTRNANKVFCLYHGHRVLVDLRTHHAFFAGLNVISALHSCIAGFSHSHSH